MCWKQSLILISADGVFMCFYRLFNTGLRKVYLDLLCLSIDWDGWKDSHFWPPTWFLCFLSKSKDRLFCFLDRLLFIGKISFLEIPEGILFFYIQICLIRTTSGCSVGSSNFLVLLLNRLYLISFFVAFVFNKSNFFWQHSPSCWYQMVCINSRLLPQGLSMNPNMYFVLVIEYCKQMVCIQC